MRLKKNEVSKRIENQIYKIRRYKSEQYQSVSEGSTHLSLLRFIHENRNNDRLRNYVLNRLLSPDRRSRVRRRNQQDPVPDTKHFHYYTISYSPDWISIQSNIRQLTYISKTNKFLILHKNEYKIVIHKKNLAKSFYALSNLAKGRFRSPSIGELIHDIMSRDDLKKDLGLDWVDSTLYSWISHSIRSPRVFYQMVRGYITNNETLLKYALELDGVRLVSYKKLLKNLKLVYNKVYKESFKSYIEFLKRCYQPENFINIKFLEELHPSILDDYCRELDVFEKKHKGLGYESVKLKHTKYSKILADEIFKYDNSDIDLTHLPKIDDPHFKILTKEKEFYYEGAEMDHCLYSNDYFSSLLAGSILILSYRSGDIKGTAELGYKLLPRKDNDIEVEVKIKQFQGVGNNKLPEPCNIELNQYIEKHNELLINYFKDGFYKNQTSSKCIGNDDNERYQPFRNFNVREEFENRE